MCYNDYCQEEMNNKKLIMRGSSTGRATGIKDVMKMTYTATQYNKTRLLMVQIHPSQFPGDLHNGHAEDLENGLYSNIKLLVRLQSPGLEMLTAIYMPSTFN